MKNKLLMLGLVSMLAIGLVACGDSDEATETTTEETTETTEEAVTDETESTDIADAATEEQPATQFASLAELVASDYGIQERDNNNAELAEADMTVDLGAEGTVIIYNYRLGQSYEGMTSADLEQNVMSMNEVIEENKQELIAWRDDIKNTYGVDVTAIRYNYYGPSGDMLYTTDISLE